MKRYDWPRRTRWAHAYFLPACHAETAGWTGWLASQIQQHPTCLPPAKSNCWVQATAEAAVQPSTT